MVTKWIDALEFEDYGGFTAETQFVQEMGQGYLFACEVPGIPVEDATTHFTVDEPGIYRIWVRTKNWYASASPGRTKAIIDETDLPREMGLLPTQQWAWEAAGDMTLDSGTHTLTMRDTTGYFVRFAAVVITNDMDYTPEQQLPRLWNERIKLRGEPQNAKNVGSFDVIIAGGGPAGVPAAIAAARKGQKVALLHSRPGLGGNASDEGTVGFDGAYAAHPNTREGGIAEEIRRIRDHENLSWEGAMRQLADAENDLTIYYNRFVMHAVVVEDKIQSVQTIDCFTGRFEVFSGKIFIDCTGDGWLGYFAGAKYRLGREAKWQHNEEFAPEAPDNLTMSGCLMGSHRGEQILGYYAQDAGEATVFTAPEWAVKLPEGNALFREPSRLHTGEWWVENPTDLDDLWEQESIRDELLRLNLGYFHWLKNTYARRDLTLNLKLVGFGRYNAKRESRRIIGDYILTQNDCQGASFDDAVSYCGWPLDVHHPRGLYSGHEGPFYCNTKVPITEIPFRCLYSKNIKNLMMAGRCISVTHLALGTVRVQNTLATLGQIVGTAAARCNQYELSPKGIYENQMREFQQELIRDDLWIPSLRNEDTDDLARSARVTATSYSTSEPYCDKRGVNDRFVELTETYAASRENSPHSKHVKVYLKNKNHSEVTIFASTLAMNNTGDYENAEILDQASTVIPAQFEGWFTLPLSVKTEKKAVGVFIKPSKGVYWQKVCCTCFEAWSGKRLNAYRWEANSRDSFRTEFTEDTVTYADCRPENVINGISRILSEKDYAWVSAPEKSLPQSITLSWDSPHNLDFIHLVFDTDLTNPAYSYVKLPVVAKCVKDYLVEVYCNGVWKTVAEGKDNFTRRAVHYLPHIKTDTLRVTVTATCGDPSARILEIRVYGD